MTTADASKNVRVERAGRVVTVTLDRPDDQNRITGDVLATLQTLVDDLAADEDTQVVVLTGGGPRDIRAARGALGRLPALVGKARALELICTGREIGAAEMERLGLVLAVHPAPRLLGEVQALAARIAASGPLATRGAKRIMNVRAADGFAAARAISDALRHALEWSHDVDEGMAAHREGRPPQFTGR